MVLSGFVPVTTTLSRPAVSHRDALHFSACAYNSFHLQWGCTSRHSRSLVDKSSSPVSCLRVRPVASSFPAHNNLSCDLGLPITTHLTNIVISHHGLSHVTHILLSVIRLALKTKAPYSDNQVTSTQMAFDEMGTTPCLSPKLLTPSQL